MSGAGRQYRPGIPGFLSTAAVRQRICLRGLTVTCHAQFFPDIPPKFSRKSRPRFWLARPDRYASPARCRRRAAESACLGRAGVCAAGEVRDLAHHIGDFIGSGLARMQALYGDFLTAIHQHGLVMGLEFAGNDSAKGVMKHLYDHGVRANISSTTATVLPIKPGTLMTQELAEELLVRVEAAIFDARQDHVNHQLKSAR